MNDETIDRISDRIVDLLREEQRRPGVAPVEMFAGQMLAMLGMLKTAEGLDMPPSLLLVKLALENCLDRMPKWSVQ